MVKKTETSLCSRKLYYKFMDEATPVSYGSSVSECLYVSVKGDDRVRVVYEKAPIGHKLFGYKSNDLGVIAAKGLFEWK